MHTCHKCGTSFEGKFCPECGERFEETTCPHCGASLPLTAKFCPECGFSAEPAPETAGLTPEPAETQTTAWLPATAERNPRTEKLYRIFSFVPAALFALASLLGFFFALAPALTVNDVLFGSGSAAMGNVYQMGTASASAITAFCVFGVLFSGMGIAFSVVPQMKWLDLPRTRLPLSALFTLLGGAACFGLFASSCAAAADVAAADSNFSNGMGMVGVGAGIILLIVFSLLFLLAGSGTAAYRRYAAKRDPSLAEQERREREELAEKYRAKHAIVNELDAEYELRNLLRFHKIIIWVIGFYLISIVVVGILSSILNSTVFVSSDALIAQEIYSLVLSLVIFLAIGIGAIFMRRIKFKENSHNKQIEVAQQLLRQKRSGFIVAAILFGIEFVGGVAFTVFFIISSESLSRMAFEGVPGFAQAIDVAGQIITQIFCVLLCVASGIAARRCTLLQQADLRKPTAELVKDMNAFPETKSSRAVRFGLFAVNIPAILIAVAVTSILIFTNPFSENKYKQLQIGDTQSRIEQVLGKADMQEAGAWYWYTDEYLDLYRRSKSLEQQYESALAQGDMAKIEELTEKIEALQTEAKSASYAFIVVTFDLRGTVANVVVYDHVGNWDRDTQDYVYKDEIVYELVSSNAELSAYYFEFCRNT